MTNAADTTFGICGSKVRALPKPRGFVAQRVEQQPRKRVCPRSCRHVISIWRMLVELHHPVRESLIMSRHENGAVLAPGSRCSPRLFHRTCRLQAFWRMPAGVHASSDASKHRFACDGRSPHKRWCMLCPAILVVSLLQSGITGSFRANADGITRATEPAGLPGGGRRAVTRRESRMKPSRHSCRPPLFASEY